MKNIHQPRFSTFIALLVSGFVLIAGTGCKKMLGLKLQQSVDHVTTTLDPRINKTALEYLQDRGYKSPTDTIFNLMYQGLRYAGIDTMEYAKTNRTFIFLHNDAIRRISAGRPTADCFFGRYTIPGKTVTKWSDYPVSFVKNYFLYLISEGQYTFETLKPDNTPMQTLMPKNVDPLNPDGSMVLRVVNDRDSKIRVNDFPETISYTTQRFTLIRTGGIISNSGPIHVADRVIEYRVK
jgi:hypothetical protein